MIRKHALQVILVIESLKAEQVALLIAGPNAHPENAALVACTNLKKLTAEARIVVANILPLAKIACTEHMLAQKHAQEQAQNAPTAHVLMHHMLKKQKPLAANARI